MATSEASSMPERTSSAALDPLLRRFAPGDAPTLHRQPNVAAAADARIFETHLLARAVLTVPK
jgi:hypothetical protein